MTRLILAAAFAAFSFSSAALAQTTVGTAAASGSVSGVYLGGTNVPTSTKHRSHPDVVAPSVGTSNMVCRYGVSAGLGNLLFGGVGGATHALDEGCEARADSAHLAALADLSASLGHNPDRLLSTAIQRMFMTRQQWEESWSEFWRP